MNAAKAAEVDPILRIIRQQEGCAFEPVKEMLLVARLFYPHLKFLVNVTEKSRRIGEDPLPLALRRGRIAKLAVDCPHNEMIKRALLQIGPASPEQRLLIITLHIGAKRKHHLVVRLFGGVSCMRLFNQRTP